MQENVETPTKTCNKKIKPYNLIPWLVSPHGNPSTKDYPRYEPIAGWKISTRGRKERREGELISLVVCPCFLHALIIQISGYVCNLESIEWIKPELADRAQTEKQIWKSLKSKCMQATTEFGNSPALDSWCQTYSITNLKVAYFIDLWSVQTSSQT